MNQALALILVLYALAVALGAGAVAVLAGLGWTLAFVAGCCALTAWVLSRGLKPGG